MNCLVEAAKNRDVAMIDMLLKYGARDDYSKALSVTVQNQDDILTAKLLSMKVGNGGWSFNRNFFYCYNI